MSIFLATQEAEIRRFADKAILDKKVRNPISTNKLGVVVHACEFHLLRSQRYMVQGWLWAKTHLKNN
jgi:hypothetical protein